VIPILNFTIGTKVRVGQIEDLVFDVFLGGRASLVVVIHPVHVAGSTVIIVIDLPVVNNVISEIDLAVPAARYFRCPGFQIRIDVVMSRLSWRAEYSTITVSTFLVMRFVQRLSNQTPLNRQQIDTAALARHDFIDRPTRRNVVNHYVATRLDVHCIRSIDDFVTETGPDIAEDNMAGRNIQNVSGERNSVARSGLPGNRKM